MKPLKDEKLIMAENQDRPKKNFNHQREGENMKCNHWWRKKSTFLEHRGCKQCLDKIEFRVNLILDNVMKDTFKLFEEFNKLPKEVQEKVLAKMDLGSITNHLT